MKKKLGTTLVALVTVLAFTACDGILECEECPTTCTPEEDLGGESGGDTQGKAYKISLETNDFIYVFDLPESADEDEEVSFKVLTESGYYASNVSVTYKGTEWVEVEDEDDPLDEEGLDFYDEVEGDDDSDSEDEEKEPVYKEVECDIEVELEGTAGTGYSFIMPDKDVTVHAEGLGAYFYLGYDSDYVVHTDYNNVNRKVSEYFQGLYEPVTGNAISASTTYIQAGRELLIVAKRPYTSENIQFYANGEKLEEVTDPEINPNEYFAFALTMPAEDVNLTVTADLRYMNVTLDTSELVDDSGDPIVDAYLYTEEDETHSQTLTGQKVANDKPYIHAEITEGHTDRYSLDSVVISWNRYTQAYNNIVSENSKETSWTATTSSTDTSGTAAKVDNDTRKFQIPSAFYSDNEITVTFTLIDLIAYEGYDFVGTWYGYEFYNSKTTGSIVNTTIDDSGAFTSSTSYLNGIRITSISDDNLSAALSDGRTFYNNGKVGTLGWYASTSSTSDVWVLANGVSNVTFDYKVQSTYIWTIRLMSDTECVGVVCSTGNSLTSLYAGASVKILDGAETLAQSSSYTVYDASGNVLMSVTAEPAG